MKRILFLLLFISVAFSCEKSDYTTIPYTQVYVELKLGTGDVELNSNLAYKTITKPRIGIEKTGFGGILVVNGMGDAPVNLYAYDLACPVEAQSNIRVVPDESGITATCPKCGAVFYIATGTGAPQSGTRYRLRLYQVSGDGLPYSTYIVHN